jgi:hypothetical protein
VGLLYPDGVGNTNAVEDPGEDSSSGEDTNCAVKSGPSGKYGTSLRGKFGEESA